jgi:hypothetical protein
MAQSEWPAPIVPLQIGVLQFPIPSAKRCYKLGQSLRTAIESYPEDLSVAIVATGGLSHQVHGERCGFNNTQWDMQFLDLIENDRSNEIKMQALSILHKEARIPYKLGRFSQSVRRIRRGFAVLDEAKPVRERSDRNAPSSRGMKKITVRPIELTQGPWDRSRQGTKPARAETPQRLGSRVPDARACPRGRRTIQTARRRTCGNSWTITIADST